VTCGLTVDCRRETVSQRGVDEHGVENADGVGG
jgi:hypothetical protein